jgi:hypothetical protein
MMAGAGSRRRAAAGGGGGDVITLSGETSSAFKFGSNATAELKCDNDGNIYKRQNGGTWNQVDTGTDWVRPAASAPGSYRCMFDTLTGDTSFHVGWGTSGTYYALTSDRWMYTYDNTPTGGGKSCTCHWHIDDGTTEQAGDVSYTMTADREDF